MCIYVQFCVAMHSYLPEWLPKSKIDGSYAMSGLSLHLYGYMCGTRGVIYNEWGSTFSNMSLEVEAVNILDYWPQSNSSFLKIVLWINT